jgi:hypothetical protein
VTGIFIFSIHTVKEFAKTCWALRSNNRAAANSPDYLSTPRVQRSTKVDL